MSPFDLNQVSVIPLEERERDHTDCSLSSAAPPNSFDQRAVDYNRLVHHHLQHPAVVQQDQFHRHLVSAGSQDSDGGKTLYLSLGGAGIGGDGEEEEAPPERPEKWMPSKMRFMRKMMSSSRGIAEGSSQIISNSSSSSSVGGVGGGVVRVCSDCNTTKTPLWRSGPRGPKSLCNACGIRQRKARRAMAAAMSGGVLIPPPATAYKVRKEKKLDIDIDRSLPFKKRCKVNTTATATGTTRITTAAANNKLCSDEALTLSSRTKNPAAVMQKVFPPEERDAAILLMTLSCGLIRS